MFIAAIRSGLKRFRRANRGSVAVEFGLIAIPFFYIVAALAEVSMMGLAQTSLDFAVSDVGRDIRTGRAQLSGRTEAQMKQALCDEFGAFLAVDCDDKLYLDVRRYDSFVAITEPDPINEDDEFDDSGFGYAPGQASEIVVVRAYYRWSVLTPWFTALMADANNGERIIVSTMMFRNEPYAGGT